MLVGSMGGDIQDNKDTTADSTETLAASSPVTQTINLLIERAISVGASDIHIEPRDNLVVVRYRVDGLLREVHKIPHKLLTSLVDHIKLLGGLTIDEHESPQAGSFTFDYDHEAYSIRVTTLPVLDGEKVVLRVHHETTTAISLTELGLWGDALAEIHHAIVQPHGLILTTGPAGSGKSTTLFSMLSLLSTPKVNIATIENEIDYHIPGANQTQVNAATGLTFSTGLRALLDQDPNIIMVGETDEQRTATKVVQAATTGHLVFTSLHTPTTTDAIVRLSHMGVKPFLVASTLRVAIAQQLVRRLCDSCKETYSPDKAVLSQLSEAFGLSTIGGYASVHKLEAKAKSDGIKSTSDTLSSTPATITKLWKAHEGGCKNCHHTGYKGRIGIFEVLKNTHHIQKLIVAGSTSQALKVAALDEGMVSMQLDGLIKALRGITTTEEIIRATSHE
jgi:type IV pilus assembly protein PilB